jgi:creatinine amidohydrolase
VLLAGLALPGIAHAANLDTADDDSPLQPKRFEEIVGFEVAEVAASHLLGILPLGSPEFHGVHNPLGEDSIIISGIADRGAARTRGLLFPVIRFAQCPANTAHFQGTISIRLERMTMYYADVLRKLMRIGFRKILILNGDDGNIGPGRGAIAQVADEIKDSAMLFVNFWEFLPEDMMKTLGTFHQANGGHGHGRPLETSAVAALRPDLIPLDKARDLPEPPDLSGAPHYFLQKCTANDWPGYAGQVSEA